jgi:hypothetical protein
MTLLRFAAAIALCVSACLPEPALAREQARLWIATFQVDATPPLGSPLCGGAVKPAGEIVDPLSARGIVLKGEGAPIVLCVVDWVGIGNGGYDAWRESLAAAAGTAIDRVAVQTVHQHDAPACDFEADEILKAHGLGGRMFDVAFALRTIERAAAAIRAALENPRPVTHIGLGRARVEKVASTRRVLGRDGKVKFVRYSATESERIRAEPEGTIDPYLCLVSFWNEEQPIASLTYYATHPQSYYGQGGVSADFPGMARAMREAELPEVAHIHFDGAGGDVTAGKYNDGSPANRRVLADRLAAGMRTAWKTMRKQPITASAVSWRTVAVALPLDPSLSNEDALARTIDDKKLPLPRRLGAASDLAWARRVRAGREISLSALRLGPAVILHMPGELFVEYQLAAQKLRPDDSVCMAAYGDYGPGYIGTAIAYTQGGYEPTASRVAPSVEAVLLAAIKQLLD